MDEREAIERALGGDPSAQRALYDAHVERVHRVAYRLSGNSELAREWTQDAFLRAFRSLDRFRGDAGFGTWLHAITVSVVLNGLRSKRRRERWESLWGRAREENASTPPRADRATGVGRRLEDALARLSDNLRTVLVLTELEGHSHAEAAEILGTTEGACRARLSRAKTQLREWLRDDPEHQQSAEIAAATRTH